MCNYINTKELSSRRNKTVDILKAIAIIAVVIGHIPGILYPQDYEKNFIFKLCYSFHMPLFIFLSGYVINVEGGVQKYSLIKRYYRLLIPWLTWTCIGKLVSLDFRIDIQQIFISPPYWFLINNFLSFLLLFLAVKIVTPTKINLLFLYLFVGVLYFFQKSELLYSILRFFPFYVSGIYVRRLKVKKENIYENLKKLTRVCVLLYPFTFVFMFRYEDSFTVHLSTLVKSFDMKNITIMASMLLIRISSYWIMPIFAIGAFYNIALLIAKKDNLSKLSLLGKYTLQIYVMHGFFLWNYVDNTILSFFIQFILALFIPIIFALAISKIKILDKILFGNIEISTEKSPYGCKN